MRVENSIGMNDYMTSTLRNIIKTMNMMISQMQVLDRESNLIGSRGFDAMRQHILSAEINLQRLEGQLIDVDLAQRRNASSASSWAMKLTGVFSAVSLIRMVLTSISRFTGFSDQYVNANARINLVNDGLQTQVELQKKVLQASRDTRASYLGTADLVAKIGMTGAMESAQAAIDLAKKVNKLLVIGGGGAQQNEAALLQFSQSLASGVMQGDEFRSLRENAPALMTTIAKGMGVSAGSMKQLSAEGKLTTDAIIKSLETMGGEIDAQFAAMPVTFGQNVQMMKDTWGLWTAELAQDGALKKLNDLLARLNVWFISDDGIVFFDTLSNGLYAAAYLVELVVNGFVTLGDAFTSMGDVSDAVLYGIMVTGILAVTYQLAVMTAAGINAGIAFVAALGPAGWIILGIGSAVGVAIVWLNHLGISTSEIFGFMGGLIGGFAAFFLNKIIFLYNTVNLFAVFIQNCFIDPVYAVELLFYHMADNILGFISGAVNGIIDGIMLLSGKANEIFGTNFGTIDHWEPKNPFKVPTSDKNIIPYDAIDYVSYNDFATKGSQIAQGFIKGISDIDPFGGFSAGQYGINAVGTVDKVKKVEGNINIAKEDIKMLMDAVTQRYVNQINLKVETAAPVIQTNATIREEADLDKLTNRLADRLTEERLVSVEMADPI